VVALEKSTYTEGEIKKAVEFQEHYFEYEIRM
jgi:hypothetical protein